VTSPGEDIVLRRDGHEVRPFSDLMQLADGTTSMADWSARCAALGIADVPMADGTAA
jgi:hypothetical protein